MHATQRTAQHQLRIMRRAPALLPNARLSQISFVSARRLPSDKAAPRFSQRAYHIHFYSMASLASPGTPSPRMSPFHVRSGAHISSPSLTHLMRVGRAGTAVVHSRCCKSSNLVLDPNPQRNPRVRKRNGESLLQHCPPLRRTMPRDADRCRAPIRNKVASSIIASILQ
jgi:hypothetical protein